ncbi:MAG: flavodoxin domain-containing protein [Lachnospiraceae bacterium]
MSKVAVVYWSGTGNTESMANILADALKSKGAEVALLTTAEFTPDQVESYTAFAFGCPSMGAEVLEEGEFQPMWDDVKDSMSGKTVALFGSYGWGDGEWMRNWEDEIPTGVVGTCICCGEPDDEATQTLTEIAAKLV